MSSDFFSEKLEKRLPERAAHFLSVIHWNNFFCGSSFTSRGSLRGRAACLSFHWYVRRVYKIFHNELVARAHCFQIYRLRYRWVDGVPQPSTFYDHRDPQRSNVKVFCAPFEMFLKFRPQHIKSLVRTLFQSRTYSHTVVPLHHGTKFRNTRVPLSGAL